MKDSPFNQLIVRSLSVDNSLIGLGILLQVAGVGGFIDVIGAIGDAVGRIGNDFTGLVTLLVVLAFLK